MFKAPLANVYDDGSSCAGNNRYPQRISDIVDSFFESFFTRHADIKGRSKKQELDITELWKQLDGKKKYPMSDLVRHGTIKDLLDMEMR